MTWELFISRMSITACRPTGEAKETTRKSINRQYVDQWAAGAQTLLWHCCPLVYLRTQFRHNEPRFFKSTLSVFCSVCVYRCVHTNSCWGRDDACGLPRMLWCHSGIAVSAGDSECLCLWLCNFHPCYFCLIILNTLLSFIRNFNTLIHFLCLVFLLFGDPLCLWSGCSNLGFHEQGHGKKTHTHSIRHFTFVPVDLCVAVFPKQISSSICPQISKELINFYDSAYIKAVDVSGSPSKDAAIKVLEVFHKTVSQHWKSSPNVALMWHVYMNRNAFYYASIEWVIFCIYSFCFRSSTAAVKEMTLCYSNKSSAPCVPQSLQQNLGHLR